VGSRFLNWTGLSDGAYYYNVTVRDLLGYENSSETRSVNLDTVPASVDLNSPQNGSVLADVTLF
jgi:hypothetical protein